MEAIANIPQWVIDYDKENHQSSAGKAIRILIEEYRKLHFFYRAQTEEVDTLYQNKEHLQKRYEDESMFRNEAEAKLKGLAIEYETLRTNCGYIEAALLVSDAENEKLKQRAEYWEKEAMYWQQCCDPITPENALQRPQKPTS